MLTHHDIVMKNVLLTFCKSSHLSLEPGWGVIVGVGVISDVMVTMTIQGWGVIVGVRMTSDGERNTKMVYAGV